MCHEQTVTSIEHVELLVYTFTCVDCCYSCCDPSSPVLRDTLFSKALTGGVAEHKKS